MQADYTDPSVRAQIYTLLGTSFPGMPECIRLAETAGAYWHKVSTPFVECAGDTAVAHAGVLALPLFIDGKPRLVAGVHAICTHPDFRGQGYARAVLEQALAYADRHFDTAALITHIPAFYEPFGFRAVPERVFTIDQVRSETACRPARRLSISDPGDLALLRRILPRRAPVSQVLSALDPGWLFLTNEVLASGGFTRLYHAVDLDLVVAYEMQGRTLRLLDLAGEEIPDLGTILARVPEPFEEVELYFTPDRVWRGPLRTRASDPEDCLMVRGALTLAGESILPPLARC